MKRKLMAMFLVATMTIPMGTVVVQAEDNEEKTTVTIWTKSRADADYALPKIEEYNQNNTDGVIVDYQIYSDNYEQAIDMAAQSDSLPDICMVGDKATYAKMKGNGQWLNLYDYMGDEMKETFSKGIVDGVNKEDNNVYYIIAEGTACRLFYNKEIFERVGISAPPETMEEMVSDAKKITDELSGEGIYGFAQNMKSPGSALGRSLDPGMSRDIGLMKGFNFATGTYEFEKLADTAKYWKELLSEEIAFPGCESLDIDPLRSQFAAGKIGMYFSYTSAEPGVYKNQFPMDSDKWDCAPIPTADGSVDGKQAFGEAIAYTINAKSEHADKAFAVLKNLILSDDYLVGHYEEGYGISIIPSVIEKANPSEDFVNKKYLLMTDEDAFIPADPQTANAQAVVIEGDDYYSAFASIIYGDADIDKTLADCSARYNAAYQKGIEDGIGTDMTIENYDPLNP